MLSLGVSEIFVLISDLMRVYTIFSLYNFVFQEIDILQKSKTQNLVQVKEN